MKGNLKKGSLTLDCEKVDPRNESVYVISEVVYAEKVIINVQVVKNSVCLKNNCNMCPNELQLSKKT